MSAAGLRAVRARAGLHGGGGAGRHALAQGLLGRARHPPGRLSRQVLRDSMVINDLVLGL